ncbi:MAG: hypothetical protein ACLFV6_05705 [Spirulinaceae cyanobacterium]
MLLWRAVLDQELSDLRLYKVFRNPTGIETKYFSESAAGASWYARQAYKAWPQEGAYTLIQTSIPKQLIIPVMIVMVDRGIRATIVPTELLSQLTIPVILPYLLLN